MISYFFPLIHTQLHMHSNSAFFSIQVDILLLSETLFLSIYVLGTNFYSQVGVCSMSQTHILSSTISILQLIENTNHEEIVSTTIHCLLFFSSSLAFVHKRVLTALLQLCMPLVVQQILLQISVFLGSGLSSHFDPCSCGLTTASPRAPMGGKIGSSLAMVHQH